MCFTLGMCDRSYKMLWFIPINTTKLLTLFIWRLRCQYCGDRERIPNMWWTVSCWPIFRFEKAC